VARFRKSQKWLKLSGAVLCLVVVGVIVQRLVETGRAEILRNDGENLCFTCGTRCNWTRFSFLRFESFDEIFHETAMSRILDPIKGCTHANTGPLKSSSKGIVFFFRFWSFHSLNSSEASTEALKNLGRNPIVLEALEKLARSDKAVAKEKWALLCTMAERFTGTPLDELPDLRKMSSEELANWLMNSAVVMRYYH
jgi:hypothetical protein